ncbi:ATP-dependent helicase NAM7 [Orbilia javanica]|uniref:ATP-dependent helicase NAM7 n=1 Tax=Orbilia javanica TaxID=47235 RepID=A0AAN8MNJ7_9PEZI
MSSIDSDDSFSFDPDLARRFRSITLDDTEIEFEPRKPNAKEKADIKRGRWAIIEGRIDTDGSMQKMFESDRTVPVKFHHNHTPDQKHRLQMRVPMPTDQNAKGMATFDLVEESASDAPGARVWYYPNPSAPDTIIITASFRKSPIAIPEGNRQFSHETYDFMDLIRARESRGDLTRLEFVCSRNEGLVYILDNFASHIPATRSMNVIKDVYSSHRQFREIWCSAAKLDYESLKSAWLKINLHGLPGRHVKLSEKMYRVVLGFPSPKPEDTRLLKMKEGEKFRIIWPSALQGSKKGDLKGVITRFDEQLIHSSTDIFLALTLYVPDQLAPTFLVSTSFDILPSFDKTLLQRQKAAAKMVHRLQLEPGGVRNPQHDIFDTILFGAPTKPFERSEEALVAQTRCIRAAGLNEKQAQAVISSLGCQMSLVQGPPGTGKSRTAVRAVEAHFKSDIAHPGAVLAGAPSNTATDNLVNSWLELSKNDDILRHLYVVRFSSSDFYHLECRRRSSLASRPPLAEDENNDRGDDGEEWAIEGRYKIRFIETASDDINTRRREVLRSIERNRAPGSDLSIEDQYRLKYGTTQRIPTPGDHPPGPSSFRVSDDDLFEPTEEKNDEYYDRLYQKLMNRYSRTTYHNPGGTREGEGREKQTEKEEEEEKGEREKEEEGEETEEEEKPNYPYEVSLAARMYDTDPSWLDQVTDYLSGNLSTQETKIFHTQRDLLRKDVLGKADIVFGTCFGLGDRSVRSAGGKLVVIDEAGQASEIETIVPIAIPSVQQVILFGDHKQLPPINIYDIKIYTQSLLERLATLSSEQSSRSNARFHILEQNYRSVPGIVEFFSGFWYESLLQPTASLEPIAALSKIPPISWIETTSDEGVSENGSKYNLGNLMAITELVRALVAKDSTLENRIAIIAMYGAQVGLLKEKIRDFPAIKVGIVNSFQGSERDIIILDLVRASTGPGRIIGFLSETRRLNVAVSRARLHLIVVGKKSWYAHSSSFNYGRAKFPALQNLATAFPHLSLPSPPSVGGTSQATHFGF